MGKTIQVQLLALATTIPLSERAPTLIVTPEIQTHTNELLSPKNYKDPIPYYVHHYQLKEHVNSAGQRVKLASLYTKPSEIVGKYEFVLTTYDTIRNEWQKMQSESIFWNIPWNTILCDEATALKDSSSQITRATCSIPSIYKVAISGNPIETSVKNLWSLIQYLGCPPYCFTDWIKEYGMSRMYELLYAIMLRRNKKGLMSCELEIIPIYCSMTSIEVLFHQLLKRTYHKYLNQSDTNNEWFRKNKHTLMYKLILACTFPALWFGCPLLQDEISNTKKSMPLYEPLLNTCQSVLMQESSLEQKLNTNNNNNVNFFYKNVELETKTHNLDWVHALYESCRDTIFQSRFPKKDFMPGKLFVTEQLVHFLLTGSHVSSSLWQQQVPVEYKKNEIIWTLLQQFVNTWKKHRDHLFNTNRKEYYIAERKIGQYTINKSSGSKRNNTITQKDSLCSSIRFFNPSSTIETLTIQITTLLELKWISILEPESWKTMIDTYPSSGSDNYILIAWKLQNNIAINATLPEPLSQYLKEVELVWIETEVWLKTWETWNVYSFSDNHATTHDNIISLPMDIDYSDMPQLESSSSTMNHIRHLHGNEKVIIFTKHKQILLWLEQHFAPWLQQNNISYTVAFSASNQDSNYGYINEEDTDYLHKHATAWANIDPSAYWVDDRSSPGGLRKWSKKGKLGCDMARDCYQLLHNTRVLFTTYEVSSYGVTLSDGRNQIKFEQDTNAGRDQQADHRSWRLGQKRTVFGYILELMYPDKSPSMERIHSTLLQKRREFIQKSIEAASTQINHKNNTGFNESDWNLGIELFLNS